MSGRAARALAAAVAAAILAGGSARALAAGAAEPGPPMTNEDVVRMVVAGSSTEAIVEAIRARRPGFDLSEEMVVELKAAGVGDAVLAAMRARVAEAAPAIDKGEPAPPRGLVAVAVRLTGPRALETPSWADEDLKQRLNLPKEVEARQVKDLAVYVACTTPEHVPDLWRGKSPLGRDMGPTPRHEMLLFVPGDTPAGKPPRLALPKEIEIQVDDIEPHRLVLGVAARIGDRWLTLSLSKPLTVKAKAGLPPLTARVRKGGGPFVFDLDLK